MTSSSHEHIKPIHHIVMQGNLSHGEIKNEMNKKIINTDQFCNVDIKILKTEDSPLSIFSKRLQHSLKQKQKQWSKHIKDRKNSFLKEQELKIKQTKKILIIQQKLKSQSGFSLKVRASNKEEKLKANKSEKKRSFEQKSVEKISLISYPVERMTGFRKKLMEYLDNEEFRNVDVFQSMHRRKSMQKRAKIQPIQVQSKLRIETQPGNLGQVYFVVPTNFSESKKKIEKKNSVVFEVSKQYKASSFRRFSKDNPKEQKVEQKQRQLIGNLKQKHKVSINKQGSISPWNQQLSGQQF